MAQEIKISTIAEMYGQYLDKVRLKEENMHPTQKVETRRAFYGAIGILLVEQRDKLAEIEDEDEAANPLESWMQETVDFWRKEVGK